MCIRDSAGIWRFDAEKIGQTQKDGELYASGLRSIVALEWNSADKHLYSVVHGRDDLTRLWPNKINQWNSALLPSEEFVRIEEGDHFGWPYCYYDQIQGKKVLAPEYGGDGNIIGRCDQYKDPVIGFPGHWAPNDLVFYSGDHFPKRYKNGAFIAFHGSTNRAPYPQSGYFVGFVPFKDGKPSGEYEVFADGFAKVDPIVSVKDAVYRPMSIAFSPDGSMYIGETVTGRIWRIEFKGEREKFGDEVENKKFEVLKESVLDTTELKTFNNIIKTLETDIKENIEGLEAYVTLNNIQPKNISKLLTMSYAFENNEFY